MARHRWDPVCPPPRGLVRPVRIDPAGVTGPTRGQAAGPRWRRTSHGFYVPTEGPPDVPEQRILEQAVRLPAGGAVTGWAACRLWQAAFFDGLDRDGRTRLAVPLALGARGNIRRDDQVVLTYEPLAEGEVVVRHGSPVCTVARAAFDAVRLAPDVREAVVVLDMVAAARLLSIVRARAYADLRSGWRRIERARDALALASEHSRSPNETRLRLIWLLDACLPPVLVNCPVLTRDGRLLGIADLLDPVAGLAVEFDGADHRTSRRHAADVAREDDFRRHGIEVARVTGRDLDDRALVVRRLHEARGRARFEPCEDRRWVARPLADDLEARLQEREALNALREEWLRQPVASPEEPTGPWPHETQVPGLP